MQSMTNTERDALALLRAECPPQFVGVPLDDLCAMEHDDAAAAEVRRRTGDHAAAARDLTDPVLVAAYVEDEGRNSLGVNYWLAQEMEARGFRSGRTAALTAKGAKIAERVR